MRIAHILSSFGMGGQERVALDLASGQKRLGHDVFAVSLAPLPHGPLAADFEASGVTVHAVSKGDHLDTALPLRLASYFRRQNVALVHTHNPQPLLYGALGGRLSGAGVVHTKHGANPDRGRRLLARQVSGRLAHAYVAVSETTAAIARNNRECSESRLHVIDNGIDLTRFAPDEKTRANVRAELGIPGDAWVVGTVGRVAPEKAHVLLVEAMAPLLGEKSRLVIVGDGSESGALRAAVDRLGVGAYVHLPGARRDVPRLLAAFDVFALSSVTEGLPLVLPEAMASGLPVVSTSVGGIPTVVDEGRTGLLVPPGDPQALRAALGSLEQDRPRARAFGKDGRVASLTKYSADRMVSDYLKLYDTILARRRLPLSWLS